MIFKCAVEAARRSNQSILKEISPEYSLEGLMLKLKLQYFGYLMRRTDSYEKTLMLGKTEGRRRRGRQRIRWLDCITNSMDMSLSKLGKVVMDREAWLCCSPWGCKELDTAEWLNWTELKNVNFHLYYYLQSFILNMKCIHFLLSNEKYWKVQEMNEPVIFLPLPECSC